MGLSEAIVKVIFWPRIRKAQKIGEAAELIGQGRADETLQILEKIEKRIPPYLGHLFFLTRGRALDALGRLEEAEQAYVAAVFSKEGATLAHVHLAVLCGKQRRFDEARDWLRRIGEDEEAEQALIDQAAELEQMLDDVESGRRLDELGERARRFEQSQGLSQLDFDEALERLDAWIDDERDTASKECDELACYLGDRIAVVRSGQWCVSLAIDECFVSLDSGELNPFQLVTSRLEHGGTLTEHLEKLIRADGPE